MPLEQTQRDAEDRTTISAWRSQASHRTNQPAQEPEAEAPRRVIKGPHATILGPVGALAKQTEWGGRTERAPHTHLSPSACRYLSGTAVLPLCKKKKTHNIYCKNAQGLQRLQVIRAFKSICQAAQPASGLCSSVPQYKYSPIPGQTQNPKHGRNSSPQQGA